MATSIIKLHTFSGASDGGPPCYILQIDQFHCLMDCGWIDCAEGAYPTELKKWVKHIDAVFLSHASPKFLGFLPLLVSNYGLKCPIYATIPTARLGHLFLYDLYQSVYAARNYNTFSLDDIDSTFDRITTLKYQQPVNLSGHGHGITATPLQSGHMLGGSLWKFVKDDTEIVYAASFNHKRERHLNGAAFDACMRPYLLIMDGSNTLYSQTKRKDRDEHLKQTILQTLKSGGNVLIASDTAGRSLEVAHYLENSWHAQDSGLMAYGLAILNHVSFNVLDFSKTLIEWMSNKVMKVFEDQRINPFAFRHVQLCHSLDQLDLVPEPKVVIASMEDLKYGFSRQIFAEWCTNKNNAVILTSRTNDTVRYTPEKASNLDDFSGLVPRLIGLANEEPWAYKGLKCFHQPDGRNEYQIPFTIQQRVLLPAEEYSKSAPVPFLAPSEFIENEEAGSFTEKVPLNNTMDPELQKHVEKQLRAPINEDSDSDDEDISRKNKLIESKPILDSIDSSGYAPGTQMQFDITLQNIGKGGTKRSNQLIFPTQDKRIKFDEYGQHLSSNLVISLVNGGNLGPSQNGQTQKEESGKKFSDNIGKQMEKKKLETGSSLRVKMLAILQGSDETLLNLFTQQNSCTQLSEILTSCKTEADVKTATSCMISKCVSHEIDLPIRCRLHFIDYEGRSDGEAIKKIVAGLRPQELIIVGASHDAVEHLAQHCRSVFHSSTLGVHNCLIHTPAGLDLINCTKEGDIYQARISDSLMTSLQFTKIRDYELAWVTSDLELPESLIKIMEIDPNADSDIQNKQLDAENLPILLPASNRMEEDHETVFVNEPKLSDLKQILIQSGFRAEFVSGTLMVNDIVAIKRTESRRFVLDGTIGLTFLKVRNILYQQFAIL